MLALGRALRDVTMFAAPTMVRRLVDRAKTEGSDGEGIRTIVYGGGPMYVADIEEAVAVMGPRFVQIYGQGESPMTITALARELVADRSHPRWRERLGSVGVAQSCVTVRVSDENGEPLAPGETGEILVRGAPVMLGYWRDPEATGRTLRDGWLWTGDVGSLDADGFLTLKDRSKDVIISGGSNIYPREVEEVLLLHPALQEVSVVGRPSTDWGEEVVAFVVPKPGAALDPAELDRLCLAHIARFKRPKSYFVESELPKNNYGKVLKTELRRRSSRRYLRPASENLSHERTCSMNLQVGTSRHAKREPAAHSAYRSAQDLVLYLSISEQSGRGCVQIILAVAAVTRNRRPSKAAVTRNRRPSKRDTNVKEG